MDPPDEKHIAPESPLLKRSGRRCRRRAKARIYGTEIGIRSHSLVPSSLKKPRSSRCSASRSGTQLGRRIPTGFPPDRKSTRLNSSHSQISYAVFCLKKKKKTQHHHHRIL